MKDVETRTNPQKSNAATVNQAKMGNYAQLSKMASEFDGPENFIRTIENIGIEQGRTEMIPVVVGASALSSAICAIVMALIHNREKKAREEAYRMESNALRISSLSKDNCEEV